uniref:C-type lectin domain-containing protein n=1 Tax=Electrophorus electricus TaxID=8005 RepID=A0A4W4E2Y6_ELEEL
SEGRQACSGKPAAVCLGLLCVLLLAVIIGLDQLQSSYDNLTMERDAIQQFTMCFKGWRKFGSSYYYFSNERKNWAESWQYCREMGADLVIINSREEQVRGFIKEVNIDAWIGLSDAQTEGIWKWVDGSPLTTEYWRKGEPNGAHKDEDCAVNEVVSQKMWNDMRCSYEAGWICESTVPPMSL